MAHVRSRSWLFTHNNHTEDVCTAVTALSLACVYMIVGEEVGASGTPHLQGYLYMKEAKTLSSMRKKLPGAHLTIASGTPQQNKDYCSATGAHVNKPGWQRLLVEAGTLPRAGDRTDIENVRDELKDGANMRRIVETATSYQSIKIAEVWLKYNEAERDFKPEVRWYHGSTGSGKTRAARDWLNSTGGGVYKPLSYKWFEGYDAHENVLLDEIRGDWCKFHEMLSLLDRYSHRVECKGGSRQLLAKKIAITSPYPPDSVWNKSFEDVQQLLRRIDEVVLMGDPVVSADEEAAVL
jgi:hypothetical protein